MVRERFRLDKESETITNKHERARTMEAPYTEITFLPYFITFPAPISLY